MSAKDKHASLLDVLMDGRAVGRLAKDPNERGSIWFQYDPEWISGEGIPRLEAIAKVARDMQIKDWRETVGEVFAAVEAWETFATKQKVPKPIWTAYRKAMQEGPCFAELAKAPAVLYVGTQKGSM